MMTFAKTRVFSLYVLLAALSFASLGILITPLKAEVQPSLTLDRLIAEALTDNPEITAFKKKYEAANARIMQAAALADPMLEFEYDKINADRDLTGEPMKNFTLSQEIPFPTKLYLRAKIAAKLAKMAYQDYKAKEKEVIAVLKATYAELFLIDKSLEIQQENKNILEQFSQVAATRYSAGKGTQADALKAQVELAKVENELIMLAQKRRVAQARLNILVNKDPGSDLGSLEPEKPVAMTASIEKLSELAKQNSPELKAYRIALEKGRSAYQLSLSEYLPDFKVSFRQGVAKGKRMEDSWAGMLGVTIPLWFVQKQAFGVKEMRSELGMLEAEYSMKAKLVLFDVQDAHSRFEANKKLIELYETAFIPQAEQTVNAALKGYQSGQTDFLALLDSQRMLTEFKLEHYKAILGLRIALADLERVVGTDIE